MITFWSMVKTFWYYKDNNYMVRSSKLSDIVTWQHQTFSAFRQWWNILRWAKIHAHHHDQNHHHHQAAELWHVEGCQEFSYCADWSTHFPFISETNNSDQYYVKWRLTSCIIAVIKWAPNWIWSVHYQHYNPYYYWILQQT